MKPTFDLENRFSGPVVGIDEAGCGPWAGPVVAGAVIFLKTDIPPELEKLIRDSKTLSPKRREEAFTKFEQYQSDLLVYSSGLATVEEIDAINIGQATRLAMKRAVEGLPIPPAQAVIDGIRKPDLPCPCQMVVKGDQSSLSIAAASIVAKVTRDRIMEELHKDYPAYGWEQNAGYGTALHQEALAIHGVTPHHRRSYAPIAKLLAG